MGQLDSHISSWKERKISAIIGDWDKAMSRPSHCLYSWPLNKKKQLVVAISKSFVKQLLIRPMKEVSALIKILFTIILIVSRKGALVYRFSTSYEVIYKLSAWKFLESRSETKDCMGLPQSPIFADIFLSFHEEMWLSNCPIEFKPIFHRRYVDDTFILFSDKSHAPKFLNYIINR